MANIEGGTPWRGHETLNWMPAGNIFWSGAALNETPNPSPPQGSQNTSITSHATATSMNIAGKAPSGATDLVLHRGIAYGIPATNFYAGALGNSITGNTFEWATNADMRNTYYRAVVEGVGLNNTANPANRVDVVNSSWGGDGHNLTLYTTTIDAVAFEGNQTRGSTIVFSAGNEGPGPNSIGAPSVGFNTLVVGALGEFATDAAGTATFNAATSFSSRGPLEYRQPGSATDTTGTNLGNIRARIDLAAPGFQMRLAQYSSSSPNPSAYINWFGTSFAAPTVAGGIALLADYAWSPQGPPGAAFAVDGRVIKAVLINSADKTRGWNNGQTWNGTQWATNQGLDYATGGGRLNLDQAFAQYANVSGNPITQLINPPSGPHSVLTTGWARATIDRPDAATAAAVDFVLTDALAKNTELNATLVWFVNRTSTSSGGAADVSFHNLDLEVWLTDGAGTPVTRVGVSTADHNNTEHLSFLVPQAGQYLVRVLRPAGSAGTYYSFAGDSTSDVFGLAWMARPGLQVLGGTTTISTGTAQSQPNVLLAPDSGQTATLTVSGSGTRVNVLNRLLVGGTDRGAGGTGVLNLASGASVNVSNALTVYPGGGVSVSNATLSGGVLEIHAGSSFSASGTSVLSFSRIDTSAPITVAGGANVTIGSFRNYDGANSGQLNILSAAATFDVEGQLTLYPVVTGSHGLVKNGAGTLILAPTDGGRYTYSGTTVVNAGTLRLAADNTLPHGANVTVEAAGTFDVGSVSNGINTHATLTLNGGTLRAPSGSGNYFLGKLVMTEGTVNVVGSTNFALRLYDSATGIVTNAASSPATMSGPTTGSRILNDSFASLPITVADGSAAIDLDAGILFSGAGSNANFTKLGAGTMRITNPGNTANFIVQAGSLRVDAIDLAPLGTGSITLNGGILTYGHGGADGGTAKVISVGAGGGAIEVMTAGRTLTLNGTNQIDYTGRTLTKLGPGTLVLSGSNVGNGASTLVVATGLLRAANNAAIPSGSTVQAGNGGTFEIGSGVTVNGRLRALAGGTLAGTGAVATNNTVTLDANAGATPGGTISPGAAGGIGRGTLTFNGNTATSASAGSQYVWQVNAIPTSGTAGTNWDFLSGGSLLNSPTTPPTAGNPFVIEVVADGTVTGFNNQNPYTWTVATFPNGIGIPQSAFAVVPTGWGDLNGGSFSATVNGTNLDIVFSPVPEPGTVLGLALAALGLGAFVTRRAAKAP